MRPPYKIRKREGLWCLTWYGHVTEKEYPLGDAPTHALAIRLMDKCAARVERETRKVLAPVSHHTSTF